MLIFRISNPVQVHFTAPVPDFIPQEPRSSERWMLNPRIDIWPLPADRNLHMSKAVGLPTHAFTMKKPVDRRRPSSMDMDERHTKGSH